jgi:DNA-binding NtrC family response regulator
LSAATLSALAHYSWPGNIRELQNVLASLAVRCPKRGIVSSIGAAAAVRRAGLCRSPSSWSRRAAPSSDRSSAQRWCVPADIARVPRRNSACRGRGLAKLLARLEIDEDFSIST